MKKNIIIISVVALVLMGGCFYWFEYRPQQIIKACQLWSMDRTSSVNGDRVDADYFFKKCLRENGVYK